MTEQERRNAEKHLAALKIEYRNAVRDGEHLVAERLQAKMLALHERLEVAAK